MEMENALKSLAAQRTLKDWDSRQCSIERLLLLADQH